MRTNAPASVDELKETCPNVSLMLHEQLLERERRNSIILDNTDEGVLYYCLKNQTVIDCNRKAFQIFECSSKEILLDKKPILYIVTGMTHDYAAQEFLIRIVAEAKLKPFTYVYQVKNKADEKMMIKGRAVYDDSETEAPKIIFFLRDITEK